MSTTTIETKWFHFSQNNSGGSFDEDHSKGIGTDLLIEAVDANHANSRAETIGIYFDGCASGRDCSCCGDRWSSIWSDEKGDPEPMIYGTSVDGAESSCYRKDCFIHPITGPFRRVEFKGTTPNPPLA